MQDIFISYARQDEAQAERLAIALQSEGWTVFWDRKLVAGEHWSETLEEALRAAKAVVVLWSSSSIHSTWVRAEATEALSQRKLLPIRIEPITIPLPFGQIQTIDLFESSSEQPWSVAYGRLAASLAIFTRQQAAPIRDTSKRAFQHAVPERSGDRHFFDWKFVFFALDGRINRKQYWVSALPFVSVVTLLDLYIGAMIGANAPDASVTVKNTAAIASFTVALYPNIAIMLKRLHDFNWSGWWTVPLAVLSLMTSITSPRITAAGTQSIEEAAFSFALTSIFCVPLILLGIRRGDTGVNRFGPPPIS